MTDESSQTALTAQQIDSMLKEKLKRQDVIIAADRKIANNPTNSRNDEFSDATKAQVTREHR